MFHGPSSGYLASTDVGRIGVGGSAAALGRSSRAAGSTAEVVDEITTLSYRFAAPHRETFERMATSDKRKQSLYFPEEMLKEIQQEATRQDRSLSWIVQKAWKLSRKEIMKFPSVNDIEDDMEDDHRGKDEE
jgi:uncharacterized small protein (TIGR04563 family)